MLKRVVRASIRLIVFIALFVVAALDFLAMTISARGLPPIKARAQWLHRHSRTLLALWQISASTSGRIPIEGLIVANHLSYLDILLICSVVPCVFVSKAEVRHWPFVGLGAKMSGTIFIVREKTRTTPEANRQIEERLREGIPVVLFAEGTSTNGSSVLPFRPPLLEPAVEMRAPITPAGISYETQTGSVERDICFWGDSVFFPHLLRLLTIERIQASLSFGEPIHGYADRKEAAVLGRESVMRLLKLSPKLETPTA